MVQTCNSADTAHRILRDFGLVIPPEQDGLATARGGLDLIIFPDEPMEGGELAGLPVNRSLDLAREGWAINLGGGDLAAALSFQTPPALAWLYEALPPIMAAAVDGDPATPVPAPEPAPDG